ncbi:hypothetical protein SAVCW2_58760 [Streptomyces avermitilis]|nr:hypothetical protein SAVCW2_58760 [Streptomyces avermitilis]
MAFGSAKTAEHRWGVVVMVVGAAAWDRAEAGAWRSPGLLGGGAALELPPAYILAQNNSFEKVFFC